MYTDADGHDNLYRYFNLSKDYKSKQSGGYKLHDQPILVYSCEIQVVPNEIIFVEEKADYPWTQMLR